ncbi:MAG: type II CRISPR-associated endonuclease Cas1 [Candidatus Krumholzibacteriia bacterium]
MKRTIEVSSRGTHLFLRESRIVVEREETTLASIPVEDLGMVILGTTGVTISSGVLKALGTSGGVILACDDTHHPCGLFLPLDGNALHGERVRFQAAASLPLKKNLWANIVRAKIRNQAHLITEPACRNQLEMMAEKVRSGDEGNAESQAARIYWIKLFEKFPRAVAPPFHRYRHGAPPNNLLNYGYAVLRAATARALCIAGLHPAIGLHHRNRYNGFCLADDLMEPFRPYIDREVLGLVATGSLELNKDSKASIIGSLMREVTLKGESTVLAIAVERSASSLAKAIEEQVKNRGSAVDAADLLILPQESGPCH